MIIDMHECFVLVYHEWYVDMQSEPDAPSLHGLLDQSRKIIF